ncbi:MAG: septum formation protein Maf [Phycisphaerae bacterium]|nr:septum formation protein Maf [Phycisphaerae bacterium]
MCEQDSLSFILASGSPRRRGLLAEAGYRFEVVVPDVDESGFASEGVVAEEYAKRLALAKARSVAERFGDSLVLGADTVADFDGEVIGKPADAKEAEEITVKLFSTPHRVVTGVAIVRLSDGTELAASESTTVYPRRLTDEQIAEHIRSGTWRDKAGAYAIRESGDEFVERIEGSLTNVMGLPMELLRRMLSKIPGTKANGER